MLKKIALLLMLILPMSVFAQKFGHIRTQEILTVMPEYTKAQTDIQTMQQQYENEFKIVQEDFQKKFTAFQQEQANLPKNKKSVVKEYDSLNHLFQHCTPSTALNYGAIEETISVGVLKDMANWLNTIK